MRTQRSVAFLLFILGFTLVLNATNIEVNQINKLTASDAVAYERFGHYGIALDGDTAVVGVALDECSPGSIFRCGSAIIYERNTTTGYFEQTAKLTASDANTSDQFGLSVGIEGDTIVVGAYGDDDGSTSTGSVYVFVKPEGGWSDMHETAKLKTSDATEKDYLGYSVAINGNTIVAGAYGDQDAGERTGSAYVFVKPESGWVDANETAKLTASDAASGDVFGTSVAIDGDTIVVGAYGKDDGVSEAGAAYVYVKPQNGWNDANESAKLNASDPAYRDHFGGEVAVEGDIVLVSAYLKESVGHVYLFKKPVSGWEDMTENAKLTASDPIINNTFGKSLDIQGDLIAVGAFFDDENSANNSGSVYLFSKPSAGWSDANETLKFWPADTVEDSYFGDGLEISGNRIIISAPLDPCADGLQCGAAYVYDFNMSTPQNISPALLMYLLH